MEQQSLNFDRARRTDPSTSKAAAARVKEFAANHCALIVLALKDFGPMTVSEIADRTGLAEQQVNKRCSECERLQVIDTIGETRPGKSGRQQRVWRAK